MFNRAILIGHTTADPDLKYTSNGSAVCNFTIAVNTKYRQGDEAKEEVLFMSVVVFGKQAETCGQYLSKGSPVLVEGRLRERRWEYEGKKYSKMELVANNVRFLGKREKESGPVDAPPEEISESCEPF